MNSSSTYLSSHQAAENPSATCRLTGDDSIAHKESALYRKARNLSSIHDGMPNLCRIPDGCGLVYIKMLRLSSFFCQKFVPRQKQFENIGILRPAFTGPAAAAQKADRLPPKRHRSPTLWDSRIRTGKNAERTACSGRFPKLTQKKIWEKGAPIHTSPPSPKQVPPCRQLNAPRPSRDRCPSPPAAARKAPCLRGRHPA